MNIQLKDEYVQEVFEILCKIPFEEPTIQDNEPPASRHLGVEQIIKQLITEIEAGEQENNCKTNKLMKCRHPYSKCRFMIGLAKKYRKPASERKCGVADPDTVCKPKKGVVCATE